MFFETQCSCLEEAGVARGHWVHVHPQSR